MATILIIFHRINLTKLAVQTYAYIMSGGLGSWAPCSPQSTPLRFSRLALNVLSVVSYTPSSALQRSSRHRPAVDVTCFIYSRRRARAQALAI